jgi:DNA recombination-dependent growth factor C
MHFITGPIHMIDALTGWHVGANIKKDTEDVITRVKKAIGHLSVVSKTISTDVGNKIQNYVQALKRIFNIEK